ncbi:hypothetical protein RRG08_009748 [Elysia crispata]|uniref:Uncharacterized protein n=1 Tax=Elysia crispata TaxID=231223 RepID=A0AAE0YYT9_9GAST|nr:hypothetical protein RRG08_009748 [Elysia crispata]
MKFLTQEIILSVWHQGRARLVPDDHRFHWITVFRDRYVFVTADQSHQTTGASGPGQTTGVSAPDLTAARRACHARAEPTITADQGCTRLVGSYFLRAKT